MSVCRSLPLEFKFLSPWLLAVAICAAVGLVGCGDGRPTRVPVSGRVTIDGKPLAKGYISVVPAGDRVAEGNIGPDGRFTLKTYDAGDGCVVGKHKVLIVARDVLSPTKIRWLAPPKYCELETTDLEVSVDGPTDSLTIELTWADGKPFIEETDASGDHDPAKFDLN